MGCVSECCSRPNQEDSISQLFWFSPFCTRMGDRLPLQHTFHSISLYPSCYQEAMQCCTGKLFSNQIVNFQLLTLVEHTIVNKL